MCKLSIIVPVYQVKNYLNQCINSIISQTFTEWELIVIDDGSTDGSAEICNTYESDKIRVIHQPNAGLSSARNRGLEIANGQYIGFIDSDDFIAEDYFETLIALAERFNADIVCSKICLHNKSRTDVTHPPIVLDKKNAMQQLIIQNLYNHGVCLKLFRASIAKDIQFLRDYTSEDILYSYMAFKSADIVVSTDYQGYFYRIRENSIMTSKFSIKNFDLFKIMQIVKADLEESFPEFKNVFYDKFLYCKLYYLKKASELQNLRQYKAEYKNVFKNFRKDILKFFKRNSLPLALRLRFLPVLSMPVNLLYKVPLNYIIGLKKGISAIIHNANNYL